MYDTSHEILSKDEEYELAVKMKAGCQRSKDLLIKHNVRLVYKIAGRFVTPVPFEELVQEGMIGLIKSLEKFEPERGFKISTYATNYIRWTIMRALDKQPHHGDEVEYEDGKNAEPFEWDDGYDELVIKSCLSVLTNHERFVVENFYFGGIPITQLADSMDKSRETVRQALNRAHRKMRNEMERPSWRHSLSLQL